MAQDPPDLFAEQLRKEYDWAISIIQDQFTRGLDSICDKDFLDERYQEFQRKHDPIYAELLNGMKDEALAKTFVSYWTIGQTLATQSRFWLEDAIAEIIIAQVQRKGRSATHVYSQAMLAQGHFQQRKTVAEMGELAREHRTDRTPWRVLVQEGALREIDVLVGEQEREHPPVRKPGQPRQWSSQNNQEAIHRDQEHLRRVAASLRGPPATEVPMQCNLIVIEPDKLDGKVHAWAIRFINPKTVAQHAVRKQERVNLLRLYAFLTQEKIMRQPVTIHVCLAELLPRKREWESQDHYPDYFSATTYWSSNRLWDFIGVPFGVVSIAIREVAKDFREKLKAGLRTLLPPTNGKEQS